MAALAAVAAAWVASPWLLRTLPETLRRRRANVVAYRTRLAEIDAEVDTGTLDATTAATLKQEAAARLLRETDDHDAEPAPGRGRRLGIGIAVALLPVMIAAGWYLLGGSWRVQQEIAGGVAPAGVRSRQLAEAIEKLRQRLHDHPQDADGWALLGSGEMAAQNFAAAAKAFAEANRHTGGSNPDWLVAQGQALAMADDHDLSGQPARLFAQALTLAPDNPRALWYAGLAALQAGDTARARTLWRRLARQNMPADVHRALEDQIARIGGETTAPGAAAPVSLRLTIALAPKFAGSVPAGATLFVFAKAADGPPMPLAATRLPVKEFPLQVTLDRSQAPMPGADLSAYDRWVVTARISASGQALPQAGDLQGSATVTRAEVDKPIHLVIDQRVR